MALKYYPQVANVETTCDTSASPHDLSKTQGSTTTQVSDATSSESYVEVLTFDLDVSADTPSTGNHDISIDVAAATDIDYRFRVQAIDDSGCGVDNSSGYSSEFTGTGVKTLLAEALTWDGTSERLRLSIEIKRQTGLHGNKSITLNVQDADTFIDAPWTGPTTHEGDLSVAGAATFAGDPSMLYSTTLVLAGAATWAAAGTVLVGSVIEARPDGAIDNPGGWTAVGDTNLWECIDEASADDDTTYARNVTPIDDNFEVSLEDETDPARGEGHILKWRAENEGSGLITLQVRLMEGTTEIANSLDRGASPSDVVSPSYLDYSYELTNAEADAITDYTDLRIEIEADWDIASGNVRVTQAYLELPGTAGATTHEGDLSVAGAAAFGGAPTMVWGGVLDVSGAGAGTFLASLTSACSWHVGGAATWSATLTEVTGDKLGNLIISGGTTISLQGSGVPIFANLHLGAAAAFTADGNVPKIITAELPIVEYT